MLLQCEFRTISSIAPSGMRTKVQGSLTQFLATIQRCSKWKGLIWDIGNHQIKSLAYFEKIIDFSGPRRVDREYKESGEPGTCEENHVATEVGTLFVLCHDLSCAACCSFLPTCSIFLPPFFNDPVISTVSSYAHNITHTCLNTYIHTYIHPYIHTYIRTYVHTYIRTYVHTYIRTYVHTYIRTYVHTYIRTYVHTYIRTYVHTYIRTYVHTYIRTYVHTYIRTYVHTYIRTYVHTYIRTYVHMYIRTYVHTYIHTYIHTCIHTYPHM